MGLCVASFPYFAFEVLPFLLLLLLLDCLYPYKIYLGPRKKNNNSMILQPLAHLCHLTGR